MILEGARPRTYFLIDPLVIKLIVANYKISQVVIDIVSSSDVMFYDCFVKLHLEDKDISP